MKSEYENKIDNLEGKVQRLEARIEELLSLKSTFGGAEATHGVRTPIFRNLSNFEQSPLGHRFNLSSDVKERCSSGGAAVYSYTGKVRSSTRCTTSSVRTGSRSKSGSGRMHGAFVEQPSPEVVQYKGVPAAI